MAMLIQIQSLKNLNLTICLIIVKVMVLAFLDDGKTTCQVDSQIGAFFGDMIGKVVVECKNNLEMAGKFIQTTKDKR